MGPSSGSRTDQIFDHRERGTRSRSGAFVGQAGAWQYVKDKRKRDFEIRLLKGDIEKRKTYPLGVPPGPSPEYLQEQRKREAAKARSQPHARHSHQANSCCTGAGQGSQPLFSKAFSQGHQRYDAREALNPSGLLLLALSDSILVSPKREARRVFSTAPARAEVFLCTSIVLDVPDRVLASAGRQAPIQPPAPACAPDPARAQAPPVDALRWELKVLASAALR
jgi:hypothetical protein